MKIFESIYFNPATVIFSILIAFALLSCKKKDDNLSPPTIKFIDENGYTIHDTTLLLGDFVKLGIFAESNGTDALTQFHYDILADSLETGVDTAIYNQTFRYNLNIQKGIAYQETWTFMVRDRYSRESNKISIIFTKDSASIFGTIIHIPSITLNAQDNSNPDCFYSFETGQLYTQDEAFLNQSLVDIVYYYDNTGDENTISSPNGNVDAFPANTTGDTLGMLNWPVQNVTRYVQSSISSQEFIECNNDSLLLSNTFIFSNGKRKAKNLKPGDIYAFILNDETTKGIFKVLNVDGTNEGTIEIEVKIQNAD